LPFIKYRALVLGCYLSADFIYLLHASMIYLKFKKELYIDLINKSEKLNTYNKKYYYGGNINTTKMDFSINKYSSSYKKNRTNNNKFELSKIRPLYKWILSKIDEIPVRNNRINTNYFGMFIVSRNNILRYDKKWYKEILDDISVWQSEVNHYLERSWYIFYN
jgi:hypothetical protein